LALKEEHAPLIIPGQCAVAAWLEPVRAHVFGAWFGTAQNKNGLCRAGPLGLRQPGYYPIAIKRVVPGRQLNGPYHAGLA
jgi:hypothetical protein